MITVTKKIAFAMQRRQKRIVPASQAEPAATPQTRVPRITRLMALAIRFDTLLREGVVADQTELARLAHVSQPRMTQIMNLNHLAPDIQEALLFLEPVVAGREVIHERMLRAVCAQAHWPKQRMRWARLRSAPPGSMTPKGLNTRRPE